MARGFTVIGSKFNPLSYEEMVKPLAAYTEEYNAQEAAYNDLASKAAELERLQASPIDQDVYKQYRDYSTNLANLADQLATEGLKPGSRRNILNANKAYKEQIVPIEQALAARANLDKFQAEMLAKDPTLLIDKQASEVPLSQLIATPEFRPYSYSGKDLEVSAAQAANALSKQMRDNPRKWQSIYGNQYVEARSTTGYTAQEINDALQGGGPTELRAVIQEAMAPLKYFTNEEAIAKGKNRVALGMQNAIGEEKYQVLENWKEKLALQDYYARRGKGNEPPAPQLYPGGNYQLASPNETMDIVKARKEKVNKILSSNNYIAKSSLPIMGMNIPLKVNIKLFDSDGRLRSLNNIEADLKTDAEKKIAEEAYDSISLELQSIGLENPRTSSRVINKALIEETLNNYGVKNSPSSISLEALPLDTKTIDSEVARVLLYNKDTKNNTLPRIKKIDSWNPTTGEIKFNSHTVKEDDIFNINEDKDTRSFVAPPTVGVSAMPGLEGYVLTIGSNSYLVPPEQLQGAPGANDLANQQALMRRAYEAYNANKTVENKNFLDIARSNARRVATSPFTVSAGNVNAYSVGNNIFK